MSGAFADTSFGKDTAFSSGAFSFGTPSPPVVTTTGGHFLPEKKKKHNYQERIDARARLRAQILEAIDGPAPIPDVLEPYVEQAKPWMPAASQVDWGRLYRDFECAESAINEWLEEDDDEDWLLLNG